MNELKQQLLKMESTIIELKSARDKSDVILNDLRQGYFSMETFDGKTLEYYYQTAVLKADVIFDYIFGMKKNLEELESLFDVIWDKAKTEFAEFRK